MDKTIGYYVERYFGTVFGGLLGFLVYYKWSDGSAVLSEKYYDLIIKVASSLFGFMLTILALIVNSSSSAVAEMRAHKSYARLIKYNRTAVFVLFSIILFSIGLYLVLAQADEGNYFKAVCSPLLFKALVSLHAALCALGAVETIVFVRIFYNIVLSGSKKT